MLVSDVLEEVRVVVARVVVVFPTNATIVRRGGPCKQVEILDVSFNRAEMTSPG